MNTFECTQAACNHTWQDTALESNCSICGANGERKPPAPDGELKPIRP